MKCYKMLYKSLHFVHNRPQLVQLLLTAINSKLNSQFVQIQACYYHGCLAKFGKDFTELYIGENYNTAKNETYLVTCSQGYTNCHQNECVLIQIDISYRLNTKWYISTSIDTQVTDLLFSFDI